MSSPPAAPADLPLSELLAALAARTPAPGGGSAAALACALAAALVEMVAGFGPAEPTAAPSAARLRRRSLALAEAELESYAPVLEALRLAPDDPGRAPRLRQALSDACEVPLEIAEIGAELTRIAARTAQTVRPRLTPDALTAVLLAEAGCRAAAELVASNLDGAPEDPRRARAGELAGEAAGARELALDSGASSTGASGAPPAGR